MMAVIKKYDTFIAILFAGLIMLFIVVAFTTPSFWDWLWQRHHNQLSWYIRPLFLIPFCWFAYRSSSIYRVNGRYVRFSLHCLYHYPLVL